MIAFSERQNRWRTIIAAAVVLAGVVAVAANPIASAQAAAKHKQQTITVGFFSPYGGALAVPQLQVGMEAALKDMNKTDNVRWKVLLCEGDGTPQTDVACANRFVAAHITMAFDATDFGIGEAIPILVSAGIPIVGGSENYPQKKGTAAFYLSPSGVAFINSFLYKFAHKGMKRISILVADITTWHDYVTSFLDPEAKKLGLTVNVLYYDPSAPNFGEEAAAMTASNPQVAGVVTLATESACKTVYEAIRGSGFHGQVLMGNCSQFASQLGKGAAGAVIATDVWFPGMKSYAPPAMQAHIEIAEHDLKGDTGASYWTYMTYSAVRTAAEIIDGIKGKVTRAAIITKFRNVKNFPSFLGSTMTCDSNQSPSDVQACAKNMLVAKVNSKGLIQPIGSWFAPGG